MDALAHIFFVGLQEEFAVSSEALIREMGMSKLLPAPDIKKERDQSNARLARDKAEIKGNATLLHRAREVNEYDIRLYKLGTDVVTRKYMYVIIEILNPLFCLYTVDAYIF